MISTRGTLKFGDDFDIIGMNTTVGMINRNGGFHVKSGRYILFKDTYSDIDDEIERIVLYHESMPLPSLLQMEKVSISQRDGFCMGNQLDMDEVEEMWSTLDEPSKQGRTIDDLLDSEGCYFVNEDGDTLAIDLDSEYQSLDVYKVNGIIVGFLIEGIL